MLETMCLAPAALAAFVGMLDPEIIEPQENKIIIHATEGAVEWIYFEDLGLFALHGERRFCIPDQET